MPEKRHHLAADEVMTISQDMMKAVSKVYGKDAQHRIAVGAVAFATDILLSLSRIADALEKNNESS